MTDLPTTTTHQFAALCGATVVVYTAEPALRGSERDRRWLCTGCDAGIDRSLPLHQATDAANTHAAQCRALPKPQD